MLVLLRLPPSVSTTVSTTETVEQQQQEDHMIIHRRRRRRRRLQDDNKFTNENSINDTLQEHLPMFAPVDFQFVGPTTFPKPTERVSSQGGRKKRLVPYLKPAFGGSHRPDQDAVFVFAAEYGINVYLLFLTTLRATGYDGDVVLALSPMDARETRVRDFLEDDPHVIAYVIDITCFNAENEPVPSVKGGIRVCNCDNLYGEESTNTVVVDDNGGGGGGGGGGGKTKVTPIPDPRSARPVATTRYEIYWIWVQNYSHHSWILLIDARDTVFQSNPFLQVPREVDANRQDGILLFFGVSIVCVKMHHGLVCCE
jgi:hypothetical protein